MTPTSHREPHWPKGLYQRNESFRFHRRVNGRVYVDVFGRIPFEQAQRKAHRHNLDIEDGKNPIQEKARIETTCNSFAEEWLRKKRAKFGDNKGLIRYRGIVDNFRRFLGKKSEGTLSNITYATCDDYVTHRLTQPLAPNGYAHREKGGEKFIRKSIMKQGAAKKTVYEERVVLKALFKEAVKRRLISTNPWDDVEVEPPTRHEKTAKHHPLTDDPFAPRER